MSSLTASNSPDQALISLFQAGRYFEVVRQADVLGLQPQLHPIPCQILAASCFQLAEYARAGELLEQLEPALGHDRDFLSLYGANCRRLGQLDKAEKLLSRALKLDPDAPQVRNNYANLLIDLDRLSEASSILEKLLQDDPNYKDAQVNLNRLDFRIRQNTSIDFPDLKVGNQASSSPADWKPKDPLMLAFAEEEVRQAGAVNLPPLSPSAAALVSLLPKGEGSQDAVEKIQLAAQSVAEGNADFALQLCGVSLESLGANASIYVNASDAYVLKNRLLEAEVCLLHALAIGGPATSHYLNLVSLASFRGDISLARYYLDQAAGLDPSHPQLQKVRNSLERRDQSLAKQPYRFENKWQIAKSQMKPNS
tara:strand:+ start:315 stop:1415 length:1101 start_codon:yes stop_codon:yes gene_type:complete